MSAECQVTGSLQIQAARIISLPWPKNTSSTGLPVFLIWEQGFKLICAMLNKTNASVHRLSHTCILASSFTCMRPPMTTHSYSHPPSIPWDIPSMPKFISIPTLNAAAPRKLRQLWAASQRQEQMPGEGQHLLNRLYARSDSFKKKLTHGTETIWTSYSWDPPLTELKGDLAFSTSAKHKGANSS